jgi:hypothetical protein
MLGITHKRYIKLTGTYLTSIIAANLEGPSVAVDRVETPIIPTCVLAIKGPLALPAGGPAHF